MIDQCRSIKEKLAHVNSLCGVFAEEVVEARELKSLDTLENLKKSIFFDLTLLLSHFEDFMGECRLFLQAKMGFKELGNFGEGLAGARYDEGAYFYVDPKGDTIIEGPFDVVAKFENGKAKVCFKGDCWFIDKTGKRVGNIFKRYSR